MSGDLQVSGGFGGVAGRTEDMDATGSQLGALAAGLTGTVRQVQAVALDGDLVASASLAPVTAARVMAAVGAVTVGPDGLFAVAVSVEADGVLLHTRAQLLRLADEADRTWSLAASVPPLLLMLAEDGFVAGAVLSRRPAVLEAHVHNWQLLAAWQDLRALPAGLSADLRQVGAVTMDNAATLLMEHPAATEVVGYGLVGMVDVWSLGTGRGPVTLPMLVTELQRAAAAHGLLADSPVEAIPSGVGWAPLQAPTLAGLMSSAAQLHRSVTGDHAASAVRVVRVDHPDGSTAWVVQVPGTQEWRLRAGADPADLTSDLALAAGAPAQLTAGVVTAMTEAGIPAGQPVMLVGHSQGGMVAAALAAAPAVLRRFDVRAVLTAGSPIAGADVPADVAVLALEHTQDPVPRLDLARNPDRPGWTTVQRDVAAELRPGAAGFEPVQAHDLDRLYVKTARLAERSHDPSVQHFLATARPFLDGVQSYRDWRLVRSR